MENMNACKVGAAARAPMMDDCVELTNDAVELGTYENLNDDPMPPTDLNVDDVQNTDGKWIPNPPVGTKPRVGMEFASLDDAFEFYNRYAWLCGFSVRKDTVRKNKAGVISMRIMTCSKAGVRNTKELQGQPSKRKARALTRWSCPAKITVKLRADGNSYGVTQLVEEHNHVLCTPTKTNRLRSHKRLTEDHLSMISTMKKSGIGVARSLDFMQEEVGGPSHLCFSERDVRNALTRKRQSQFGSDADALLQFFQTKQTEDPLFTYDVATDENMRLQSCFWVDRKSKEDCMVFNDVICFDTTYKTNEYDMPFGPFVGVNHHMQTCLLGAGLLFGETIEDFKWLFQTWLDAMGGVQPKTIITDQDPAIKQAIAYVFPKAHHILCLWHINKKLPNKLARVIHEHPTFKATWDHCLYHSISIDEYEKTWSTMIEDFHVHENSWLHHMHDIREMWIPAYTKGIFTAGMRTTGRSESMNAFFDGFVGHKSSLMGFADGYEKALRKRRADEVSADFDNINGKPVLKTICEIEGTMAKIYTLKVFEAFQREVKKNMFYLAKLIASEGVIEEWDVFRFDKRTEHKAMKVIWNEDEMVASCPCKEFESIGLVCRHIITLFRFKEIMIMPEKHLLSRWTRTAKSHFKQPTDITSVDAASSVLLRSHALSTRWSYIRSHALSNPIVFEIAKEALDRVSTQISELLKPTISENDGNELQIGCTAAGEASDNFRWGANEFAIGVGTQANGSSGAIPTQSSQACAVIRSPIRSQHKGRTSTRMKSYLEQAMGGRRFCRGCCKHVVGHDRRTCPELKARSPTSINESPNEVQSHRGRGRGRRGGIK